MMHGYFSGNRSVTSIPSRHSFPALCSAWLLMLVGLLLVSSTQAFASPAACQAMVDLVAPNAEEPSGKLGEWRVRAITPREGTVELLLGKGDATILRTEIRRAIWSKVDGRYVRPPCPFEMTSSLRGPGGDTAESEDLERWLEQRICCHPETVESIFKEQVRLPDGEKCSMAVRSGKGLWRSIWETVSHTFVGPIDHSRTAGSPWFAWLVVFVFVLTVFLARTELWRALSAHNKSVWIAVLTLTVTYAIWLFLLDDTVIHENYHGWETVRVVSGGPNEPFAAYDPYGFLQIILARILGGLASPGGETFLASRIASVLTVPALFLVFFSLVPRVSFALCASIVFIIQPAVLLAARAETVTSTGILLIVLSLWLVVLAARTRSVPVLVAAAGALALLGNYRLIGPVMVPCTALWVFVVSPRPDVKHMTNRWWVSVALAGLALAVLCLPHALVMMEHTFGQHGGRYGRGYYLTILQVSEWTSWLFVTVALVGVGLFLRGYWRMMVVAALGMLVLALGTMPAANSWLSTARYQLWMLVPCCGLVSGVLVLLPQRYGRKGLVGAVALAALLVGSYERPVAMVSRTHPETAQLKLWRSVSQELPRNSTLVVPTGEFGRFNLQLPDVEFRSKRPDVRLTDTESFIQRTRCGQDRTAYVFIPLACRTNPALEGASPVPTSSCVRLVKSFAPHLSNVPGLTRKIPLQLPASLDRDGTISRWWNLHPYDTAEVEIGLYRYNRPEP
ncbi:MAG: hypothetical protein CMH54_07750 [Myxococcales bacterium]|nr:hypothetical protein [Myxococcales bacterium]